MSGKHVLHGRRLVLHEYVFVSVQPLPARVATLGTTAVLTGRFRRRLPGPFATAACANCGAGSFCASGLCQGPFKMKASIDGLPRAVQRNAYANARGLRAVVLRRICSVPGWQVHHGGWPVDLPEYACAYGDKGGRRSMSGKRLMRAVSERCCAVPHIDCPAGQTSNAGATSCTSTGCTKWALTVAATGRDSLLWITHE